MQLMDPTLPKSEREQYAAQEIKRLSQLVKDLTREVDAAYEERAMAYRELAVLRDAHEARLVSYAPDGSSCTLNIAGVEHYFDAVGKHQGKPVAYLLEHERGRLDLTFKVDEVHKRLGWTYKVHELYTAGSPDADRYQWLMSDCDGDEQDNIIRWLAGTVASKEDIDAKIDAAMNLKSGDL